MSTSGGKVIQVHSASAKKLFAALVPPLTEGAHKGQMGRVGVIGGSADFTGAPYYAAEASLKFGGDLAFVFAAKQAVTPIKGYSPELMVTAFYDADTLIRPPRATTTAAEAGASAEQHAMVDAASKMSETVTRFLPRLHAVVAGPGLGREPQVLLAVLQVIQAARRSKLPLVLDADALWMLSLDGNLHAVHGCAECVLTPNANEFKQLIQAALRAVGRRELGIADSSEAKKQALEEGLSSPFADVQLRALASLLRCTVMLKGPVDLICSGASVLESAAGKAVEELATVLEDAEEEGEKGEGGKGGTAAAEAREKGLITDFPLLDVYQVQQAGSPRRCGGQGDVLAGTLGVAMHWAHSRRDLLRGLCLDINFQGGSSGADSQEEEAKQQNAAVNTVADSDALHAKATPPPAVLACLLASMVTRQASQYAFQDKRRSMTTPDLLTTIGTAFEVIVGEEFSVPGRDDEFY